MRGRGQTIIADALHVIARIDNERARRCVQPNPFVAVMIPDLQPVNARCRQQGKQINVLVAQQTTSAGFHLRIVQRWVVIEPQSKIRFCQFFIIDMWIATQALKHGLCNGFEQLLMTHNQATKLRLELRVGPEPVGRMSGFTIQIERTSAKDPALNLVRVNIAGLLYRKVTLIHRTLSLGPESHFLLERL